MNCTNCGQNPAQLFIRRTAEGEKQLHLCPSCYNSLYSEGSDDFVLSFFGGVKGSKACPDCGTTLDDFRRTNLLGCAYCYTAFREELTPTIRFIQGKLHHVGKVPEEIAAEKYDLVRSLVYEQEAVREELEEAQRLGNDVLVKALRARLEELNRRINGGENV